MACIKQAIGYIPFLRLKGESIKEQIKVSTPSQKAIASYDENPITLAYECAKEICNNGGKENIALIFVSSSFNDLERNPAALLSETLDLPEDTLALNIIGGSSSFIDGLYIASNFVDSGKVKHALVVCGEKRRSDDFEIDFGLSDSGGGVLISSDSETEYLFKIEEFIFKSQEIPDVYKNRGNKISSVDQRFVVQEEYLSLLKRISLENGKKFFVSGPTYTTSYLLSKNLKIKDDIIQTFGSLGTCYTAVMLSYSTGILKAGEELYLLSFGGGFKGLKVKFSGEKSPYEKILKNFERKRFITFGEYMRIKDIDGFPEDESSVSMLWREKKQNIRLYGQRCMECGNAFFPMQNYCPVCGSKNLKIEKLPKKGEVFTFTEDYLSSYSEIFSPLPMLVVQLENGARIYVQGTDVDPKDKIKIGDKVELTLRILNTYQGMLNYFYKARKISS